MILLHQSLSISFRKIKSISIDVHNRFEGVSIVCTNASQYSFVKREKQELKKREEFT